MFLCACINNVRNKQDLFPIVGKYQCLVQMQMKPVAVCYGYGNDQTDAQHSAAYNALLYLKTMAFEQHDDSATTTTTTTTTQE